MNKVTDDEILNESELLKEVQSIENGNKESTEEVRKKINRLGKEAAEDVLKKIEIMK